MKQTRVLMGMPITLEIIDSAATESIFNKVYDYFAHVDEKFSTYKTTSEITAINEGRLAEENWSAEMRLILALCEETKKETNGYFDIKTPNGHIDPSGIVKGWAIWNAAQILIEDGFKNFYVDAGGDIQTYGTNAEGKQWVVGIKNPWNESENVRVLYLHGKGVATSGIYIRGLHIYDPLHAHKPVDEVMSLTVVGPNVYEADRFATAAFAMGREGIRFIEKLDGFEGYMIDKEKVAIMTAGFENYTTPDA